MLVKSSRNRLLNLLQATLEEPIVFLEGDQQYKVGPAGKSVVNIHVHNAGLYGRILAQGNLGLGEAFMENWFDIETGSLEELLATLLKSNVEAKIRGDWSLMARIAMYKLAHWRRGQWKNVQHHYDTGDDLFECFLDESMTYSCGYAHTLTDDLVQLQENKFDRICRKLALEPGETLLDIGCGYGGLVMFAAKHYGIKATGITNSRHHCQTAQKRCLLAGLENKVSIRLDDFKQVHERFDKIVSVGMLEHVPPAQYPTYFKAIRQNLHPEGRGLVHFIGANAPVNHHDPFIQRYIFPDSHQPRLSVIVNELEKNGLVIQDIENMIRHYGHTSRAWIHKFRKGRNSLKDNYSEGFLRMWEYYLACCVAASDYSDGALYQVLFMNDCRMSFPLNRI